LHLTEFVTVRTELFGSGSAMSVLASHHSNKKAFLLSALKSYSPSKGEGRPCLPHP